MPLSTSSESSGSPEGAHPPIVVYSIERLTIDRLPSLPKLKIRYGDGVWQDISELWDSRTYCAWANAGGEADSVKISLMEDIKTLTESLFYGNVQVAGGRDCVRRIPEMASGSAVVSARRGVLYLNGNSTVYTYGIIVRQPSDDMLSPTKVHLEERKLDRRGHSRNNLTLRRNVLYLIAGDDSESNSDSPSPDSSENEEERHFVDVYFGGCALLRQYSARQRVYEPAPHELLVINKFGYLQATLASTSVLACSICQEGLTDPSTMQLSGCHDAECGLFFSLHEFFLSGTDRVFKANSLCQGLPTVRRSIACREVGHLTLKRVLKAIKLVKRINSGREYRINELADIAQVPESRFVLTMNRVKEVGEAFLSDNTCYVEHSGGPNAVIKVSDPVTWDMRLGDLYDFVDDRCYYWGSHQEVFFRRNVDGSYHAERGPSHRDRPDPELKGVRIG